MSIRSALTQLFPAADLIPLCEKKAEHHRAREKFYRGKFARAERALRKNGIVMRENAPALCSGAITGYGYGGTALTPQFDQKYVSAVDEAKKKVHEHKEKAEEYEKFGRAYRACVALSPFFAVKLDYQDIEFFGLGEPAPEEA